MRDIYRIQWMVNNTGSLYVGGYGNASNHNEAMDQGLVDTLNQMFPELTFTLQVFDNDPNLRAWVNA